MRGLNVMYEFMRRPSMAFDPRVIAMQQQYPASPTSLSAPQSNESTVTPVPENLASYEIDDEFNLPISIAIVMLLSYMICGAAIYCTWEREWTFFESFYFVFISISTIGEWREGIKPHERNSIFDFPMFFSVPSSIRFWWFRSRSSHLYDGFNHLSHFWTGIDINVH